MRSRGEAAAHVAAVLLLVWALVEAIRAEPARSGAEIAAGDSATLATWSTGAGPASAHVRIQEPPRPLIRDWLAALRRSGTRVTWSGDAIVPLAVSTEPVADPRGGHRVRVAAPRGAGIVLADAAGVMDTSRMVGSGATLASRTIVDRVSVRAAVSATVPPPAGRAASNAGMATASARDSALVRAVLVLGAASWESKFVIAALEEAGWRVATRLIVAPDAWVEQGEPRALDTARYSAVVALDTAAGRWGTAIVRFAGSGGGVVLAGEAATIPSLRRLVPGLPGEHVGGSPGAPPDSAPVRALGLHPIVSLASDAIVLEQRGPLPAVAARRHGLGRVVQIGYDDTWRWRMGGGDAAPRAHREWWSRVVSAVAYAPARRHAPIPLDHSLDAAPVAHLVSALGSPGAAPAPGADRRAGPPSWTLSAAIVLLLVGWGSRRLRGAP